MDPDMKLNVLLLKFDEIMIELADRLVNPNAGMMGMGKGGVPDAACLKRLGNVGLAIVQRGMLMETKVAGIPLWNTLYDSSEKYKSATDKINSIWPLMKTHAIEKGIAIDKAAPVDPKKYGTTVATVRANKGILFMIHALEGIDALTSSPECRKHKRLDHFATNVIGGKKDAMGLEAFKADAKAWIRDSPKEEEVNEIVGMAMAERNLTLPKPPGYNSAAKSGGSNLQARLNALKRGGSRRRKHRRNRKTKRRHQ